MIGGEQQEADGAFDNVESVLDAASLGMAKGVIMLGHVVSEQPGIEDYANWLRTSRPFLVRLRALRKPVSWAATHEVKRHLLRNPACYRAGYAGSALISSICSEWRRACWLSTASH